MRFFVNISPYQIVVSFFYLVKYILLIKFSVIAVLAISYLYAVSALAFKMLLHLHWLLKRGEYCGYSLQGG